MNRRNFMKAAAVAPLLGVLGGRASETGTAAAGDGKPWCGKNHPLAGKKLPPWKPGEFQVHFIYTGVAESMFWILPDGTTMLLDCGDHKAWARGCSSTAATTRPGRAASWPSGSSPTARRTPASGSPAT